MIIEIFSKQRRQRNEEECIPRRGNDMCRAKMCVRQRRHIQVNTPLYDTDVQKKKKMEYGSLENRSGLQMSSTAEKLT